MMSQRVEEVQREDRPQASPEPTVGNFDRALVLKHQLPGLIEGRVFLLRDEKGVRAADLGLELFYLRLQGPGEEKQK